MIRKHLAETVLLFVVTGVAISGLRTTAQDNKRNANIASREKADLVIRKFAFPPDNDKAVLVHILNTGGVASALCVLRLTVRKINGVPVGRIVEVKLPPLAPGKETWLAIGASKILPNNVTLASTTFKLNADATSVVVESNEGNNEIWHQL